MVIARAPSQVVRYADETGFNAVAGAFAVGPMSGGVFNPVVSLSPVAFSRTIPITSASAILAHPLGDQPISTNREESRL